MSHTPGPWQSDNRIIGWLSGDAPAVAVRYVRYESGRKVWNPVCMVQPHLSGKYSTAGSLHPIEDARLIAAAPELYEAGKRMAEAARSWHDFHHGSSDVECDDICAALPALEAAIEKAEGKKEPSRHDAHLGATEA